MSVQRLCCKVSNNGVLLVRWSGVYACVPQSAVTVPSTPRIGHDPRRLAGAWGLRAPASAGRPAAAAAATATAASSARLRRRRLRRARLRRSAEDGDHQTALLLLGDLRLRRLGARANRAVRRTSGTNDGLRAAGARRWRLGVQDGDAHTALQLLHLRKGRPRRASQAN